MFVQVGAEGEWGAELLQGTVRTKMSITMSSQSVGHKLVQFFCRDKNGIRF